jgi:hypothetical protein
MPQNRASFSIEDFSRESSRTGVNIGPLTAANFTAKRDAIDDLKLAIDGIILGEIRSTSITESFAESSDPVATINAQRERKWLVTARDVTQFFDVANTINNPGFGELFQTEVPTANIALITTNTDEVPLTEPAIAAFVTAFEAIAHSPTGGNQTEVVAIRHVGRNL